MSNRKCAVCGTTQKLGPTLGGVLLCQEHYHDISAQVEALRAEGKMVNVAGMARQMYRERHVTSNYLLRDIPEALLSAAKERAQSDGMSLRELIFLAVEKYVET